MNYKSMSDFEVNAEVSKALGAVIPKSFDSPYLHKTESTLSVLNGDGTRIEKVIIANYCKNPSYAWPIILENNIHIAPDHVWHEDSNSPDYDGTWEAEIWNGKGWHCYTDRNPLRAAMIMFLVKNEADNEN